MQNFNNMNILRSILRKYKSQIAACTLVSCFFVFSLNSIQKQGYGYRENFSIEESDIESSLRPPHMQFESFKKILYFNKYFHLTDWRFGFGNEPFLAANCPVSSCYVTDDRNLLPSLADFDAILFHARDMDRRVIEVPSQLKRKPNQIYVFFLMESPLNDGLNYTNKRFHNFFNWTMTYRVDSDIYRPYGWVSELGSPSIFPPDPDSIRWRKPPERYSPARKRQKTKMVAWVVSNCNTHSNREDYVELLKKHIDVDVFGACGDLKCGREEDHNTKDCDLMLERDYRYYLSFENSFCAGYVSEKFYKALSLDIIPIVMGGANYTTRAPPKSYINVLDFENPKQLAEFLIQLANDEEEYQSYFWWKEHYEVHNNERKRAEQSMCKLCEKLHENQIQTKSYDTLGQWWWGGGHCTRKGHVPWYRPKSFWSEKILQFFPLG